MDRADIVPTEIRLLENKDILIIADHVFDPDFEKGIKDYCKSNGLKFEFSKFGGKKCLVKNPKNA